MEKSSDEKWRPSLGETVLYKPLKAKRGIMPESRRVIVQALYASGTIAIKLAPGTYKHVNPETLQPL